ncbi:SDR family NAD(P)-dependent oxidoreductase [Macrococcus animalis]|uniref:SDR family NAD(P)-dependent oxidoreductase n=1 Tax=Macrococcus animalis TaxID=3395467 RepID=UPI0039BF9B4A
MIGKRALITGATSGVGKQLTEMLLFRGVYVTAVGRRTEELSYLNKMYDGLTVMATDLLKNEDFEILLDWIDHQEGFDYLINCAGFAEYGSLLDQSDQIIADIIHVNLTQTVILTKHVVRKMDQGGMVVTIGSQSANVTTPFGAIYAASKSGLNHVMNALRLEQQHINFLNINTGPVNTQFIKKANKGKPMHHLADKVQLDVVQLSEKIIEAIIKKKTEMNLPIWMDAGLKVYGLAPRTLEKLLRGYFMTKK